MTSLSDIPKILPLLSVQEQELLLAELDKLYKLRSNKLMQERFLPFVKHVWPSFIPGAHHAKMAAAFERVANGQTRRLILNMPPRHCLALDTPVLTTAGWKTMETVQPGDYVFGPDGEPTRVLGKSDVHRGRALWRVSDAYGNSVLCDHGHLWNVALCPRRQVFRNMTAQDLGRRKSAKLAWIPDHAPVWFPETPLPVDPFVLGTRIRASPAAKYIPTMYMCASANQRRALLKGLTDTGPLVTSFPTLRDQYIELLWGLGMKAELVGDEVRVAPPARRHISFERAGTGDVQCIEVARWDGLFLAGRALFVTHNTKSEFASYLLPAWFLGKYPAKKVIQTSHTAELAVGFGRKVRNLVDTEVYHSIFPDLVLSADSKAAGRWNTSKGGDYFAIGVGGAVTGKGADLLIIDDPHALAVDTPIATPDGWKTIGTLCVGDYVYGPDGRPTEVTHKSPVYKDRELYEVKTSDGASIYADAKHLWNVRVGASYRNLTTEELVESGGAVPLQAAVQYPAREEFGSEHIPASVEQRWDLLHSLGSVTASGQYVFRNKDEALVRQVVELLHSLGRKCRMRTYNTMHRVTSRPTSHKRARTRSITVTPAGQRGAVQCITVAREDGLFLAGRGYVVTHNSEQEAALAESNPAIYDSTYEWYTSGPRQRLQPGGAIVVVMCMTGDTPVLRPDGTETPLCDIRPGDLVATYESGHLTTARVLNFQSSGYDDVFTIKTQSGKVVRANGNHPFLVEHAGERKWARLKHLCPGMSLVGVMDARDLRGRRHDPVYAPPAKQKFPTTGRTRKPHTGRWATMVNGRVKPVHVVNKSVVGVCARPVIESSIYPHRLLLSSVAHGVLSLATVLPQKNMLVWSPCAATAVTCAATPLPPITRALIGMGSCVSTTTTIVGACVDFCVTIVTSQLATAKRRIYSCALRNTYRLKADPIVEIVPAGREEVFDIEVEHTANFIAGGLVSHNTRWSRRDLTARVLDAAAQRGGEEWEVIEFPAILPSGKPLWPQFWPEAELLALREELPNSKWQAQYQQSPTSDAAAIVKREWWQIWEKEKPPACEFVLTAWDTAFEKTQRADYSACTTWGVFYKEDGDGQQQANIILLNAFRERMEFPTLKQKVIEHYKDWEPDSLIVEKKASGAPLIYELRAMGIPVQEFTPTRGNDKISRLNAVADIFASGRVWAPQTRWAEEVIDEVAEFPAGQHDDYADTVSMALARFRRGGYISTNLDDKSFGEDFQPRHAAYY